MKVIIAGSRGITDIKYVSDAIIKSGFTITEIVSGGARGVDRLGESYAKSNRIMLKIMNAEWDKHGKRAGFIRNIAMADYADALIAVWDGSSRGTLHIISCMKNSGKPIYVMTMEELIK